jgi:ethanolamine kinase
MPICVAQIDMEQLAAEVDEVQAACDALGSPVVYSHNDLLAPNLLIQDPAPADGSPAALYLIDFEYGCYNHRGFDLGNHFNEWAGFDCFYDQYPNDAQQRRFLGAYAKAAGLVRGEEGGSSRVVDALVQEANVFSLASHLYWGIWALIQAKYSAIDFDYLAYHGLRLAEMRKRKAEVLAMGAVRHAA